MVMIGMKLASPSDVRPAVEMMESPELSPSILTPVRPSCWETFFP